MNTLFNDIKSEAKFSECGKYRYMLSHTWDETKQSIVFIGLNPSTATAEMDDPTIRRVKRFAKDWGYGGVHMMNLFAWVTPYPDELLKCADPIGENDKYFKFISKLQPDILFAWGSFKEAKGRAKIVSEMFPNAVCLGFTKDGSPKHPLYVAAKTIKVNYKSAIKK